MSSTTKASAVDRIIADNDPRNGTVATRLIRMLEHPERQPDADGLYHDREETANDG